MEKSNSKSFGTQIPHMQDIVGINGSYVVDKDGNEFDPGLVRINTQLGGGFELVSASLFDDPRGEDN